MKLLNAGAHLEMFLSKNFFDLKTFRDSFAYRIRGRIPFDFFEILPNAIFEQYLRHCLENFE